MMNRRSDALGRQGEAAAEAYLVHSGMQTLVRRYRGGNGELDLVMADGDVVVFVEVKFSGRGSAGTGMARVTPAKQRRMISAAAAFLQKMEWMDRSARFDVVEITAAGLRHVPCAFEAGAWY